MAEIRNYTMNFGPQHPAAHGVLRLVLELDGEVVQRADPHIGLLHRATEKLAETRTFLQSVPYMDRLDYVSMMANEHAYVMAIEKLAGRGGAGARAVHPRDVRRDHAHPEPPAVDRLARARRGRDDGLPLRLPRARGPLRHVRGGLRRAHARGLLPPGRRLPRPARTACRSTRRRPVRSAAKIARAERNRQGSLLDFIEDFTNRFPDYVDDYETLLTENRIWKQRTVGIGVVSPERAQALGFTGPMLRGSGVAWDLRKKQPYEVYDRMDFDIPDRHQRRLLRPLPRARAGDARVEPHHQAVRRLAAQEPRPGDHRQPQGGAALARAR